MPLLRRGKKCQKCHPSHCLLLTISGTSVEIFFNISVEKIRQEKKIFISRAFVSQLISYLVCPPVKKYERDEQCTV
jgi:hypothetical protein